MAAKLDGAALGAGVRRGTLVRRAIELGLERAAEEAREERAGREGGERIAAGIRRDHASPAARRERPKPAVVPAAYRLDECVAPLVGDMVRARRAINAGLVRVGGRVVRDPMARVDPQLVEVES